MIKQLTAMPKYEAYKYSSVEWLSKVPEHWEVKRFKHHFVSAMGETILASNLIENGILPVFSATEGNHYFGYVNESSVVLKKDDLVIPARGNSIGFPKLVQEKATCSQTTIYAKKSKEIDSLFVFYYLIGCKPYLFQFTQTAIPQITVNEVKNNFITYPPLSEQTAIAAFLDRKTAQIDQAVAIKEKQIDLLNERKQIMIQNAVTRGLNPDAMMHDSGVEWIGEIPTHWEVRRSKYVFTQRKELAKRDDIQLSATQAYGVIPQDEYESKIGRRVVKIQFHLDKRKHVELDDFVISMRSFEGGLERAWSSGCIRSSYVVLRPLVEIHTDYYSYLFKSPRYISALQSTADFIRDGQDLNFDNFSMVDLLIIPLDEQKKIATYLENQVALSNRATELLQQQIDKLKEYKATLINGAVTGKIMVPELVEEKVTEFASPDIS